MATLSELITTLKGKMLPLAGGTLTGALTAPSVSITNDNAKVNGKNIVRSVNGTSAGTDGNVTITVPSGYVHPSTHPASMITGLATVATSGKYSDLSGKPSLATVATTGSYNDLSNKPSIPSSPRAYVTSTWRSDYSWYRKYSDGWIEQGGKATEKTGNKAQCNVTLHVAMSDANYTIVHGTGGADNTWDNNIGGVTTTGFVSYNNYGSGAWWLVCGYMR